MHTVGNIFEWQIQWSGQYVNKTNITFKCTFNQLQVKYLSGLEIWNLEHDIRDEMKLHARKSFADCNLQNCIFFKFFVKIYIKNTILAFEITYYVFLRYTLLSWYALASCLYSNVVFPIRKILSSFVNIWYII